MEKVIAVNRPIVIFFGVLLLWSSCGEVAPQKEPLDETVVKNPFFGITPRETPKLLAPELLASPVTEYNGTFSPDGTEFFYTTDTPNNAYITYTQMMEDSTWSEPRIAPFSGEFSDYDPLFAPDGNRLYFSSSRPEADNANSKIWYVQRAGSIWGDPKRVVLTGEEDNEYYSSLTNDGTLYFNIWSKGDIYRAIEKDSGYEVEVLPESINSGGDKGDPFIDPDEEYLIFRGYDESLGRGDLYISFNIDGEWTKPENLGEPINSEAHEMCPWVSQDGKLFIFASGRVLQEKVQTNPSEPIKKVLKAYQNHDNGQLNLYYVSTDFITRMRAGHSNEP